MPIGVGQGFLLFTNPDARQITAYLLRSTANAIAPEKGGKTFQDKMKDAWWRKSWRRNEKTSTAFSPYASNYGVGSRIGNLGLWRYQPGNELECILAVGRLSASFYRITGTKNLSQVEKSNL